MRERADGCSSLDEAVKVIERWSADRDVPLLPGFLEETGQAAVAVIHDDSIALLDFLETCKRLCPRLAILNVTKLDEDTWSKSVAEAEATSEDGEDAEVALAAVRACRRNIGHVAALELFVLLESGPTVLRWERFAEWFELIYGHESDEEADAEWESDDDLGEFERRKLAWCETNARQLAESKEFQTVRNRDQRKYVARQFFKEREGWDPEYTNLVVHHASAILESEVRPRQEADLRHRARQLHADGVSPRDIAAKLGVTSQKLRTLLAD